jgi:sugar phosphate isomerase/epimerase
MKLIVFRSLWGVPDEPWSVLFPKLKRLGYGGIECSLGDIGDRGEEFRALIKEYDMEFICGVYTSWQDYEGHWENKSVKEHLQTYHEQLELAKQFRPMHINVHSGSDSWTREQCEEFFSKATEVCTFPTPSLARKSM